MVILKFQRIKYQVEIMTKKTATKTVTKPKVVAKKKVATKKAK